MHKQSHIPPLRSSQKILELLLTGVVDRVLWVKQKRKSDMTKLQIASEIIAAISVLVSVAGVLFLGGVV